MPDEIEKIDSIFKITLIDEKMVVLWKLDRSYLINITENYILGNKMPMIEYIRNNHRVGDMVKLKISLERLHKEEDVKI